MDFELIGEIAEVKTIAREREFATAHVFVSCMGELEAES
jgi:hypothetical protein